VENQKLRATQKMKMERESRLISFFCKQLINVMSVILSVKRRSLKGIFFFFKTNVAEPRLLPRQSGSKIREKLPDA
jgi:hypothetical protein